MIHLENEFIRIAVKPLGAELCSIFHKQHRLEYMWQAGKAWPKHSPVLFPIVGQLKNNCYSYRGKEYILPRHGFAREMNFSLDEQSENRLLFRIHENEETLKAYPFAFNFMVEYILAEDTVMIKYSIVNTGKETMYFSVGGHPAFRVPLDVRDRYEDYFLEFSETEDALRWPLLEGGLATNGITFFTSDKIHLNRSLFEKDALVFKKLKSASIRIKSLHHAHGLSVLLHQCPYLGIWAAKGGDFVCIEPWQGIADAVNTSGKLEEKEGIVKLDAERVFSYEWEIELF